MTTPPPNPNASTETTAAAPMRPTMPSREVLVLEAIDRLDTAGVKSRLLAIDGPTMRDLGLKLTDRTIAIADAHRWLCEELGDESIDDNMVYRFATHFRRIYGQVRAEHARRVARLTVAEATDESITTMTRLAQHRLMELTAERLVDTEDLEEMTASEFAAVVGAVKASQVTAIEVGKLHLENRKAADRAEKLAAEVKVLNQRLTQLPERVKGLQGRIDDLSKRVAKGESIPAEVFATIRAELTGLLPAEVAA